MKFRLRGFWFCAVLNCLLAGVADANERILVGWGGADITPDGPVMMRGGVVSKGVRDPITATALALESMDGDSSQKVMLISCDLLHITDGNRNDADMLKSVRTLLGASIPELRAEQIIMMATHTHVAPSVHAADDYNVFASGRIAKAALQAWQDRKPGGISFGLSHAVVGHHRIATYRDGSSHMVGSLQHGSTANERFSHIEGFEDHSVHLLSTWDENEMLTGVVVNTACPAQVLRGDRLSSDYWHEVRENLKHSLGPAVHLLPQLSAAGDLATAVMVEKKAEARMRQLMFPDEANDRDRRVKQIAESLSEAILSVLPLMKRNIEFSPKLSHRAMKLELPGGFPDVDPDAPTYPIEIHAVRIGDVAMVTNPFELYVDYGVRIKGKSPAIQTFVVQLAGSGSYLPTSRAVAGGGYGAIAETCVVGHVAGQKLVDATVVLVNDVWRP